MVNNRELIIFALGAILGVLSGFFTGKAIYDSPIEESVKSDTVWITDTIPDYNPELKDSAHIKWVTKWLPKAVHDTIDNYIDVPFLIRDTVAVEIPITSKHYGSDEYDAYISGFEPSLDSIKIYQKTQYVTTTVTKVKPPNKYSLTVNAGVDYGTSSQFFQPYAFGELTLNNNKMLQLGIKGGVKKNEVTSKFEPLVGAEAKIKLH